jgi:hypothetical protein
MAVSTVRTELCISTDAWHERHPHFSARIVKIGSHLENLWEIISEATKPQHCPPGAVTY